MKTKHADDNNIWVSLIIPCHNACPELKRTIKSVIDQTFDHRKIEVILVDDGSTDDTWSVIRKAADDFPEMVRIKRLDVSSGSPSQPRNTGLSMARGEYVFCLDADDWLGEEALERMEEHVRQWQSDVLYVKLVSEGGREVAKSMFVADCESVDVFYSKIFWSLAPFKLIRRSLIEQNNIRFSEKGMPEDIIYILKACVFADKVSVASDYGYYHYYLRPDERGTVNRVWTDLSSNLAAYHEVFEFVDSVSTQDQRNAALMRRLFKRDFYRMLLQCSKSRGAVATESLALINDLFADRYQGVRDYLSSDQRRVFDAALSGDAKKLKTTVRFVSGFLYNGILRPAAKKIRSLMKAVRK